MRVGLKGRMGDRDDGKEDDKKRHPYPPVSKKLDGHKICRLRVSLRHVENGSATPHQDYLVGIDHPLLNPH